MDRVTEWRFCLAFSWALRALLLDTRELGWSQEELQYPDKILRGEKIPGDVRLIQDRFSFVFQDFFRDTLGNEAIYWHLQAEMKDKIFLSWRNWRG